MKTKDIYAEMIARNNDDIFELIVELNDARSPEEALRKVKAIGYAQEINDNLLDSMGAL